MYRMLIIDNEPIIVDGLYDLFQEVEHVELDVLKAHSASEALNQLSMHKIDIVFADIQMPGMNGLELQQTIKERWPRCKVIFLTGFNDFSYAQTAIRNGGFDYVLKTEGDDRILEAFHNAISSIQELTEKDRFIEQAKQEMYLVKPMLQKEYIISLLEGDHFTAETLQRRFGELDIRLRTDLPVLMTVGRVDEWPENYTVSDRLLLMFAIHNIAQEYLAFAAVIPISYDRNKIVWFIQTKASHGTLINSMNSTISDAEQDLFANHIHEILDSIQSTCKDLLKLTISLVTHQKPCLWKKVSGKFDSLNRLLGRGLGLGKEILLIDTETDPGTNTDVYTNMNTDTDTSVNSTGLSNLNTVSAGGNYILQNHRKNVTLLESYLEGGAKQEFSSLCRSMLQSASHDHFAYTEIYYSIATMILSYLNRIEATRNLLEQKDLDGLMRIEERGTWEVAAQYFAGLAQLLFEKRLDEKEEKSHAIVNRLHQYIHGHLDNELSLNRLSEVVYLNPSYLSRLYKQMTGHGLAEYISEKRIEKATALLRGTSLKIHEVARQVGLEPGYFIKMFKKYVHMTPQEYREMVG